ncbi:MAG: hypothetical protein N2559_17285, partial [Anaerolineae bacterium]|nr:hypothetical protein [Anaerolineae bacterium]
VAHHINGVKTIVIAGFWNDGNFTFDSEVIFGTIVGVNIPTAQLPDSVAIVVVHSGIFDVKKQVAASVVYAVGYGIVIGGGSTGIQW